MLSQSLMGIVHFFRDLHGHKIQLFEQGVVAYKRALGFRDFTQLTVGVLDSVGRVDDPSNFAIVTSSIAFYSIWQFRFIQSRRHFLDLLKAQ